MLLVVEVAFTSVRYDLWVKAGHYAGWGVDVYWVIDLPRRAVVVHSDPSPEGYRRVQTLRGTDRVPLPARDASLSVADILGTGEHTPIS